MAVTRLILALFAATVTSAAPAQPRSESITYETGPCFGRCPVYAVTVRSDGTGRFEGHNFTAVNGVRHFRLSPRAYRAFAERLAPHRPRGVMEITYNHPRCRLAATDHPSVTVTWRAARREDRLSFYYGCRDPGNAAMARALESAPELLPIGDMIRARQ
jgi:hypothetical protein